MRPVPACSCLLAGVLLACSRGGEPAPAGEVIEPHSLATPIDARDTGEVYFEARPVTEGCAQGSCGWWVHPVNQQVARCVDGSLRAECRVDLLDLAALGLTDEASQQFRQHIDAGESLLKGTMAASGPKTVSLRVTHGWIGHGSVEPGAFTGVEGRILCSYAGPCTQALLVLNQRGEIRHGVPSFSPRLSVPQRFDRDDTRALDGESPIQGLLAPDDDPELYDRTLFLVQRFYTSAILRNCEPNQAAQLAAQAYLALPQPIPLLDGWEQEQALWETNESAAPYLVVVSRGEQVTYRLLTPDLDTKQILVARRTCAVEIQDPPTSKGIY